MDPSTGRLAISPRMTLRDAAYGIRNGTATAGGLPIATLAELVNQGNLLHPAGTWGAEK